MKNNWKPTLVLTLALSLAACGPAPTNPKPKPTSTPAVSPTPGPSPSASTSPTPTPNPSNTPDPNENAKTYFFASLSGSQETPPVNATGTGSARLVLNPGKSEAQIDVVVSGLSGPITGAHIHRGGPGQAGAVVKELEVKGNVITGMWRRNDSSMPFTEELLNDLQNGNLYVNVHTAANPGGELRGQLTFTNDQLLTVYLSSSQEVPAVSAAATGTALVRISRDNAMVSLDGYAQNLSGEVTGAHIHSGAAGVAGAVVKDLSVENNSHFSVTWRKTDSSQPLTDELLASLRSGNLYVNLHTVINPGGELRGQIGTPPANLVTTFWFSGEMMGSLEVPAVETPAFGAVKLELNAATNTAQIEAYVSGLSGPVRSAHLHQGAPGVSGPVVKDLMVEGTDIEGVWKMTDTSQPLTKGLLADLLLGNLYVNVHTDAHPGGELRGQLTSTTNKVFSIGLEGTQEVPAVTTNAQGAALIMLSSDHKRLTLKGKANNLSGPIVGAHIHSGPEGLSGPVVKDLSVNGSEFSLTWTNSDQAQPLTPDLVTKLLSGGLYINLHTNANPNGEIRGQIEDEDLEAADDED
ncbi:MAG TPA: CHRD domain-containing protein [Candidatus Obscuribacterales bacterium]